MRIARLDPARNLTTPLMAALFMILLPARVLAADKIRVAFSAVSPTQGALWVAQVGGGIAAEMIYTRAAIETLVAGEVPFSQMTGSLMFSARLQGADPIMIAGVQDVLNDCRIVRPQINSIEELKAEAEHADALGSDTSTISGLEFRVSS